MAPEPLFEIARRRFDTPEFHGMEFIEAECKTIINPVPGNYLPFNWSINPYRGCSHACSYCFARPTHTFLDMNAGSDFEKKIVVKVNAPEVLRRQLAAKRWKGEGIAMGTATETNVIAAQGRGSGHAMPTRGPRQRQPMQDGCHATGDRRRWRSTGPRSVRIRRDRLHRPGLQGARPRSSAVDAASEAIHVGADRRTSEAVAQG